MNRFYLFSLLAMLSTNLWAQPANDNCSNATNLTNLNNHCYTNQNFAGATFDLADGPCTPNYSNPPNTWYRFTALHTVLSISANHNGDRLKVTLVEFAPGQPCVNPTFLDCGNGGVNFSNLVVGNEYYIIISKDPAIPIFTLCIDNAVPNVPVNNEPCNAIQLNQNQSSCGNNQNATSTFDPSGLPCPPMSGADVWYRFTVTAPNNTLTLNFSNVTVGGGGNGQVLLGQWSNGCSGTFTFRTPAFCGALSSVVYSCLAPGTYYVMVSTAVNNAGAFCITAVQSGPPQGCAQNDLCSNAVSVTVPQPGNNVCVSGCNSGACGESNLNFQGCNLSQQSTVWHTFTTGPVANLLYNLSVNGGPHTISLFTGTCNNLTQVLLCQPVINSIALTANTTYFVAISTQYQNAGNYNFCIQVFNNPSICALSTTVQVMGTSLGSPLNGPYQQGEAVSFCLRVTNWDASQNNCQWMHGIVPIFGNGWDPASFDGAGQPVINKAGPDPRHMNEGYWDWFQGVAYNTIVNPASATRRIYTDQYGNIRICSVFEPNCDPAYPILTQGASLPGGWFVCRQAASQGPCPLNWGDGHNCGSGHGPWSVCFDLLAKEFDEDVICEELTQDDVDCSVKFFTMADGETGSWSAFDCAGDIPAIHNATVSCCTRPIGNEADDLICSGSTTSISLTANQNPISFSWTVLAPPGVSGAASGSGTGIFQTLFNSNSTTQRVRYLVVPTNEATDCVGRQFEVLVDVLPEVRVTIDTDPADKRGCASTPFEITATASGGSGSGYIYRWSSGEPNDEPSIIATPGSPGRYSYVVTVTDDNGCTITAQEVVEIFPQITADLEIDETVFCEEFAPKTLYVITGAVAVERYDWAAPGPPIPTNRGEVQVRETGYYGITVTDVNGCTGEDEIYIQVNQTPEFFILNTPPDSICIDVDLGENDFIDFGFIWINISQDPVTWEWKGTSFPDNQGRIYPKWLYYDFGAGTFDITLILESVHGCIDSITHQFEIVEPPVLNLLKPPAFCATALPYILQATPAGGTWSGSGVSGSIFDPLTAGPGSHTVFYELIQGGCRVIDSMTLIVNPPPIVNIVPVTPACFGDPFFQLNANPGGGQWSGTGVIDPSGIFDPVTAGSGLHTVTYTYREGACNFPYTTNIRVYPELNAQFNTDAIVCLTSETLARFSGVAPAGTAFDWVVTNGTIVENDNEGNIRIQWNASGTNRISLRLSIADCEAGPFSRDVIVEQPLETPQLDCDSLSTTSVHFSWLDVTNAIGYEVRYGSQVDTIVTNQYAVTGIPAGSQLSVQITVVALGNGICGNSAPAIIECTSLPCPDIRLIPEDEDIDLCVFPNSSPTQLIINIINSDGSGVGVWSGPGVNPSGRFDPRAVNEGTHLVTFTLTEQSCPYNANIVIRTFLPPIAEWEADKYLVCTDEIVVLDFTGILRRGGTPIWDFDGAEIVSGTGFGPYELRWSNGGQKNVTLMVDDSQCRSALYERMIDVEAPLELPLISCESNPISVRFFWDQVPGATGFVIVINNGAPININPTDTSYLITGLNQGDRVSIRVYATGDGVCGNGPEAYFECEAKECPRINVEIDDVAPICLTSATAPVQLQLSISGSNQTGTGLWSGPGVNQNGMFNPSVAGPGLHSIDYRFTEEFCNYFANVQIRVHPQPNANFSIAGPVCTGQLINAVHPGNLIPGSVYHWSVDGAQINSGAGTSNIQLRWATPGIKTIRLIVYENGCPSEPVTRQLEVEAPLTAPIINCEPSTTEILFRWEEVPGASAYEVQINGNPVFVTTDLARLVDGLTVGQQVTITIRALGSVVCGNGPYTTLICEAEPCPIIQVQIRQEPFICLSSTTQPIQLAVQVSGEVVNGTGFWSGNGITDLQNGRFDPQLAGIGTHEIIYTFREKGCNYMDTIQISVRPQPINAFSSPGPICVGQELDVQFTGSATGAAIFQWALDGATIISGEGTRVLELLWTTAGIKTIRLQVNDNGCISAPVSQTVEVQRPLLDPVIRCNSTLTSIGFSWDPVQNSEGYLISINGGPPFVFNGTSYPFPDMTPGDSITFRVIAINNGPCGNSGFDELTCFAADCRDVVLTFEQVPPICNYPNAQDITLKAIATNGHGGGAFTWSGPGITSPSRGTFNPGVAGLGSHEVAVTYRESVCPYRSSFIVRVVDIPVLTVDTFSPVCFGIHTGVIEIERVINGEEPYQFSINNGGFSSAMRFASLSPGVYQVSVRDQNGCMATVPATLIQPDRLTVNLGPDRLEEAGEEFEIIPIFNVPDGEIVSYYWYGFDQISCPTCPLALMTLFEQTRIYIEVEDIRGCKALDDVNIAVRKKRRVFIPTSFSPNNDGINDFFTVFSAEEVESVELMQIFDRWGEKLFTKSDFPPNEEIEGWDGSHGGRSLNPGVFVYHFRVRFRDGSTGDYQGDVTLLKN